MKKAMNIHLHSNPKITTGPMALYREPKPEPGVMNPPTGNHDFEYEPESEYAERFNEWLTSLLAYIKEPGWGILETAWVKEGDRYYDYIVHGVSEKGLMLERKENGGISFLEIDKSECSHYHEGQQMPLEKFRYVEELTRFSKNEDSIMWQEVKEPDPTEYGNGIARYNEFQKGKRSATILLEETKQH